MAIQSAINTMIGAAGTAAVLSEHLAQQKEANEIEVGKAKAEIAATQEKQAAAQAAYRNDTIEAASAISAHEKSFKPMIGDKEFKKLSKEEIAGLTDEQVKGLADEVEKFRSGKMTEDRIGRLQKAGRKHWTDSRDKNKIMRAQRVDNKNASLNKAYESFRELNERIEATRELKFDIEASKAKIAELEKIGGKK